MINPRTIAQEIAYADVATQAANLQEKQSELDAESSGLDSLSSALSDFQSAVDALNSDTDGPVTFAATSNNDSATVSANSQAQAGSYSFFVEQLAQGQQTTFSMGDDANTYTDSSNGIITLRQQNIDDQMSKIQDEGDQLTDTYNANYDRYLEEYTNTLVEVYTMKASMAAFA